MNRIYILICAALLISTVSQARAESYDAVKDGCAASGGVWSYEGYRAGDGAYLPMVYGHAPITEVSKYGIDASFIPDSGQPYYPFVARFPGMLVGSPATLGKRFDLVLTWTAPRGGDAVFSGYARLMGGVKGGSKGGKVKAFLMHGGKILWAADIEGGATGEFKVSEGVAAGDKVRLHIQNAGGSSGDITAFDMGVEAP